MPISRKLASLLNGVSQLPPEVRHPAHAEIVENCLPHVALGLLKRPPVKHVAVLDALTTGYENPEVFMVSRSNTEKYFLVVSNGNVAAFDASTGVSVPVVVPDARGLTYLQGTDGYRAVTVGDTTLLINRGKTVKRGATKAPAQVHEALLFVRQADFSTTYDVVLDGTPISVTTVDASNPAARSQVTSDNIAAMLYDALTADPILNAFFGFIQLGSTIHVQKRTLKDFSITTADGLADKGLKVIKGSTQSFDDLPTRAVNGMIVEIAGAPESSKDNYWVQYDDSASPGQDGVWRECPKPGTIVDLDQTTMPWQLVLRGEVRERILSEGEPDLPVISKGADTTYSDGWQIRVLDGNPLDPTQDVHLLDNDAGVDATLTGTSGNKRTVAVAYDVDTNLMEKGRTMLVNLHLDKNDGSGFQLVDSQAYSSGVSALNESLGVDDVLPAGSKVRLQMQYPVPTDYAPTQFRKGLVVAHRQDHQTLAGIQNIVSQSTKIAFNAADIYPLGTVITINLDGTDFTHTVTTDTETGTSVATALHGLINPSAAFDSTNPSAGVIMASTSAGLVPVVTATVTLDPTTTLTDYDLTLTPGELVGKTIKNITDGSTGIVTSNGVHTIVCSAGLSGGVDNKFLIGDECSVLESGSYFVLRPVDWAKREAGDLDICPLPSFVDGQILDGFFYKNRLGFTSDENVVLSRAGDLFRFVRQSQAQLLDDDAIDVKATFKDRTVFRNALPWTYGLLLFSDIGPFILSGEPHLSPTTVRIDPVTTLPMDDLRPLQNGDSFFMARSDADSLFAHVHEMKMSNTLTGVQSTHSESTEVVPRYLSGSPISMAGDGSLGFLAVVLSGDTSNLFVFSWKDDEQGNRIMAGWHRWIIPGANIMRLAMTDTGLLGMFVQRAEGMCFEIIDVHNPIVADGNYTDRLGFSPVAYTMRFRPSPLYERDDKGQPLLEGRTTVQYMDVFYSLTKGLSIAVTPQGRSTSTMSVTNIAAASSHQHVPVKSRGDTTVIEVTDSSNNGVRLTMIQWEGTHFTRNK